MTDNKNPKIVDEKDLEKINGGGGGLSVNIRIRGGSKENATVNGLTTAPSLPADTLDDDIEANTMYTNMVNGKIVRP